MLIRSYLCNLKGHVANEVETEQIVSEPLTTGFTNAPAAPLQARGYANYTAFVQIRGSIPLTWVQDNTNLSPRPPIESKVGYRVEILEVTHL